MPDLYTAHIYCPMLNPHQRWVIPIRNHTNFQPFWNQNQVFLTDWNRNRNRNQKFCWNRNRNREYPGIEHLWSPLISFLMWTPALHEAYLTNLRCILSSLLSVLSIILLGNIQLWWKNNWSFPKTIGLGQLQTSKSQLKHKLYVFISLSIYPCRSSGFSHQIIGKSSPNCLGIPDPWPLWHNRPISTLGEHLFSSF